MTDSCANGESRPLYVETRNETSYRQILKSSTIIGGSQIINAIFGLLRTKAIALIIGPSGVGLLSTYQSLTQLASTMASFGLQTSGVREIAKDFGADDWNELAKTTQIVRRLCWCTGLLGLVLMLLLAPYLSKATFGNGEHAWPLSVLAITILINNVTTAQNVIIHGTRRVSDLAKINIFASLASTAISIAIYLGLGIKGMVPVLLLVSMVNLVVNVWFANKVKLASVEVTWVETWLWARRLIPFGLAMVVNGLATEGVAYGTRLMVISQLGLDGVGIYTAAFVLSGLFVQFVLQAMGADFYPRLTAASADHRQMTKLINEQTEIGILLAFPGLLGTMIFAPYLINLLYTSEFSRAAHLLQFFALGCYGKVLSWPLGFSMLAKGQAKLFAATEFAFNLLHLSLIAVGLHTYGLNGIAIAFAMLYAIYPLALYQINKRTIGFTWSGHNTRLIYSTTTLLLMVLFACSFGLNDLTLLGLTATLLAVTGICLYKLNRATAILNALTRRLASIKRHLFPNK
jgi:antigen flippase